MAMIEPVRTSRFATDTAVQSLGGGRYEANIDHSWWIIHGPNGGYVAAIILRAMVAEAAATDLAVTDPAEHAKQARSATFHFLRSPVEGPVRIEVAVERSGRSVTNLSARLIQNGRLMVVALAAVAAPRPSAVMFDDDPGFASLPGGPPPRPTDVAPQPIDPDRNVPMRSHYDMRWVFGDLPFHPNPDLVPTARCGGWLSLAEPVERVDETVLCAMSDAWLPPIFSRIDRQVAVPTVELTVHFRRRPPEDHPDAGWCLIDVTSPVAEDGYVVEHGRILGPDGRLVAESRQLAVVV